MAVIKIDTDLFSLQTLQLLFSAYSESFPTFLKYVSIKGEDINLERVKIKPYEKTLTKYFFTGPVYEKHFYIYNHNSKELYSLVNLTKEMTMQPKKQGGTVISRDTNTFSMGNYVNPIFKINITHKLGNGLYLVLLSELDLAETENMKMRIIINSLNNKDSEITGKLNCVIKPIFEYHHVDLETRFNTLLKYTKVSFLSSVEKNKLPNMSINYVKEMLSQGNKTAEEIVEFMEFINKYTNRNNYFGAFIVDLSYNIDLPLRKEIIELYYSKDIAYLMAKYDEVRKLFYRLNLYTNHLNTPLSSIRGNNIRILLESPCITFIQSGDMEIFQTVINQLFQENLYCGHTFIHFDNIMLNMKEKYNIENPEKLFVTSIDKYIGSDRFTLKSHYREFKSIMHKLDISNSLAIKKFIMSQGI